MHVKEYHKIINLFVLLIIFKKNFNLIDNVKLVNIRQLNNTFLENVNKHQESAIHMNNVLMECVFKC